MSEFKLSCTANEINKRLGLIETLSNEAVRAYDQNMKSINHRGYSAGAPENTIPAYILSRQKGFNYAECDVSFTSDGVAVLLHDATIDRTSNGSGKISDMTYEKALLYDFGSWFSSEYTGVKIPTFSEFIVACKRLGLHPYIELKSNGSYTQSQITQIVNEVESCGMKGKVTYISFSNAFLKYVNNADPSARLGYLVTSITSGALNNAVALKTTMNEVFMDVQLSKLTDAGVQSCIEKKLPLEVWTVNTEQEILNMSSYISGVTSDNLICGKVLYDAAFTYTPPESDYIHTTSVMLNQQNLTFDDFTTKTLIVTVEPSNASDPVVWSSNNTSVAKVSNGMITPVGNGSCTITAISDGIKATCSISVALTNYSITRILSGCSSNSMVGTIVKGQSLTETITPNVGYSLKDATISIICNGVDITNECYANGVITINNVFGDIIIDVACVEVPTYTIARNLINCTSNSTIEEIGEGNPHTETFTANSGYRLDGAEISITMNGVDITSKYNNGVLAINEITGDIIINITCKAIPVYTITNNLTNVLTDNSTTSLLEGSAYTAKLTVNGEGKIDIVTVIMDGIDITNSVYNNGQISISSITGNVVITATATIVQLTLLHNWDFTKSLTDTVGNVTAETTATQNDSGIVFSKENVYINLTPNGPASCFNKIFEIDIPTINIVNKSTHMRLLSISEDTSEHPYHDTSLNASTFIYRYSNDVGWTWYTDSWGDIKLSKTDYPKNFADGKTVRLVFDSQGYLTVSMADIGSRNFIEIIKFNRASAYETGYWVIGSSYNNFMYNFTFSGVRVYDKG